MLAIISKGKRAGVLFVTLLKATYNNREFKVKKCPPYLKFKVPSSGQNAGQWSCTYCTLTVIESVYPIFNCGYVARHISCDHKLLAKQAQLLTLG